MAADGPREVQRREEERRKKEKMMCQPTTTLNNIGDERIKYNNK